MYRGEKGWFLSLTPAVLLMHRDLVPPETKRRRPYSEVTVYTIELRQEQQSEETFSRLFGH